MRTEIQLAQVNDAIVSAVRKVTTHKVEISDNKLIIDAGNTDAAILTIIEAIVSAGGRIQLVTELSPTLEDVYLKTVKWVK